jgi:hypothetical protein
MRKFFASLVHAHANGKSSLGTSNKKGEREA